MSGRRIGVVLSVCFLVAIAALGGVAYGLQFLQGDVVTGMRGVGSGGAAWGLYVVMDGCFLGAGVALMAVACFARLSRDRSMEGAARIAMPSAIASFLGAGLSIMADQGRPLAALWNLSRYARPQSPMFVTFTSVGAVCLFASLLHCVLARRPDLAEYAKRPSAWQRPQRFFAAGYRGTPGQRYRRRTAGFWMSLLMLPALFAPATALAILFAVRPGRAIGLTLLEVAAFLTLSLAAGLSLLIVASAAVDRLAGAAAGLPRPGWLRLGRWLLLAVSVAVLVVVTTALLTVGARDAATASYGRALLHEYRLSFWGAMASLFVAAGLLWMARLSRHHRGLLLVAAIAVEVAVYLHHYMVLVAWQTHGLALPWAPGRYSPTWIELAVVAGIVAVCLLALLPAVRLIPFAPLVSEPRGAKTVRDRWRSFFTWSWFALGLMASGVGLVASARVGTEPAMDPVVPWSPVVFIAGLVILSTTAAVYELLPERA
jgi:Ni/Fe-hydrogenase subunit HybB-like protein